jgi:O-acetyl-ADP-ribose deacetylase (regulator of RNase III)
MKLLLKLGDLLDEEADCLICTANPWLNMSGGVNGAILARGNGEIQAELRRHLAERGLKAVPPASVVRTGPGNLRARMILHCVTVTAFYESSPALVEETLKNAFAAVAEEGCRTVAMPMLATGFGPLTAEQFGAGVRDALRSPPGCVEKLTIVVRRTEDLDALNRIFPARIP